jgi:hypothetical protein
MRRVFLDTSFFIALVIDTDAYHDRALRWRKRVSPLSISTEFVLIEFLDGLSHVGLRQRAIRTIEFLRQDSKVMIVPLSSALLNRAISLYAGHQDKEWGITDCVSFIVMNDEESRDALTSDRHFEQAGFRALLRIDPSTNGGHA